MSRIERDGLADREALVARWTTLTRDVLPGMAAAQRWPIRFDHCFMRVCLDAALGTPWTLTVARPAIRNMDDRQLAAAVEVAEGIAADPATLASLNQRSIAGRGKRRNGAGLQARGQHLPPIAPASEG